MSGSSEKAYAFRVCDTLGGSGTSQSPIQGYEKAPLVSLEMAVEPLRSIVPRVAQMVHNVRCNIKNSPDNLSMDESAAIMLYTYPWTSEEESFYFILNATLRAADQVNLKPWFLYLNLLITALKKLPSVPQCLYRGVKKNLVSDYSQEKEFFWWGFTSCTSSIDVLQAEIFLGKTGSRTIFSIQCYTGKDIRNHSFLKKENEILLLPGCKFQVVAVLDLNNGLNMIQIKQVDSEYSQPESINTQITSTSGKSSASLLSMKPQSFPFYHNADLEKVIQKYQSGKLDLSGQQINHQDMTRITGECIIKKKCKILILMEIEFTHQCVSDLADAIRDNQYLEKLEISYCSITNMDVRYLASVINTSVLKYLNLSANSISDEGAKYLAEALVTNMVLIELSLSTNQIGNGGLKMLADALICTNKTLKVLKLSSNIDINDDSIDTLTSIIQHTQSLTELDVRDCDFSVDGEKTLQAVAKLKKKFKIWLSHVM